MKVSFTAKEYARLLELVQLGLSVVGARPDDPATMPDRYSDIAQKSFGLAEPMGCADLVEVDVNGQYFPSEKLTAGAVQEKLERFVDDTFWSELVGRLAERDLRVELGPGALEGQEELTEGQEDRLQAIEEGYWREFETHGVEHVVVLHGGRG